jgi:hypothetical protein
MWLAESDLEGRDHRVDAMGDAEIGEVAPVLVRAAHLDIAQRNAPHAEFVDGFEQLARTGKQGDAGHGRRAHRAANCDQPLRFAFGAERLKSRGEHGMCVLDQRVIVRTQRGAQGMQAVCGVDLGHKRRNSRQAALVRQVAGQPIRPERATNVHKHRSQHSLELAPYQSTSTSRRALDPA